MNVVRASMVQIRLLPNLAAKDKYIAQICKEPNDPFATTKTYWKTTNLF